MHSLHTHSLFKGIEAESYALPGKTQEPVGLFLQCIIRITECCESDDEGKWDAVFHGFFQGGHGKHKHR